MSYTSRLGLAPTFSSVRRLIQTMSPRMSGGSGGMIAAANRTTLRMPRIWHFRLGLPLADLGELLVFNALLGDVEPPLRDALDIGELDLLGSLVPFRVRLHGVDLLLESPSGQLRARRVARSSACLVFSASTLSNVLGLGFERFEPPVHRPLPLSLTNDSSPASTSTQLSTNGTLSNSRSSIFRRRSSKNCSPMKSRSAIAITLIFAGRRGLLVLLLLGSFFSSSFLVSLDASAGSCPVIRAAIV